jgi:hypothetical protein
MNISTSKKIIGAIIFAVVVALLVFFITKGSRDASWVELTDEVEESGEVDTLTSPEAEEFAAGIAAGQEAFQATDPSYPEKKKFTFAVTDGVADTEMFPTEAYMWQLLEELAPTEEVFNSIVSFTTYYDEKDLSDASVTLSDDSDEDFDFELNFAAARDFESLIPIIVHEFAHILSLKDDQVTSYEEDETLDETCEQYLIGEGCLLEDSYLGNYYDMFWNGNPDFQEEDRKASKTEAFFATRQDAYVSDYATTNPIEDFAESFMYYTTKESIESDTIKGQKVNFFQSYPELVDYRARVRNTVSGWAL